MTPFPNHHYSPSSLYLAAVARREGKTFSQLTHQVAKKKTTASDPASGAVSGGPVTATSPGTPAGDGAWIFLPSAFLVSSTPADFVASLVLFSP